jgi:hypothetical protein
MLVDFHFRYPQEEIVNTLRWAIVLRAMTFVQGMELEWMESCTYFWVTVQIKLRQGLATCFRELFLKSKRFLTPWGSLPTSIMLPKKLRG